MAHTEPDPSPPQRGQFAAKVARHTQEIAELKEQVAVLIAEVEALRQLIDPQEIDYIWQNMKDMTEIISALRRYNGFQPLAEFSGTKARRRKSERVAAA